MPQLTDRRVILAAGAGLALALGLGVAFLLTRGGHGQNEAPPASTGGLVVQTGRDDDIKLDARRPLRCFVGGQFVGELTLNDCARRNGVATGALDVGVDQSGALAASNGASANITPLPPPSPAPDATTAVVEAPGTPPVRTEADASGECWRYGGGDWKQLSPDISLGACVQALFAGKCEPSGGVSYGRWEDKTLRLSLGRVEISDDNLDFRALDVQTAPCPPPDPG